VNTPSVMPENYRTLEVSSDDSRQHPQAELLRILERWGRNQQNNDGTSFPRRRRIVIPLDSIETVSSSIQIGRLCLYQPVPPSRSPPLRFTPNPTETMGDQSRLNDGWRRVGFTVEDDTEDVAEGILVVSPTLPLKCFLALLRIPPSHLQNNGSKTAT
jgi:hypothetical protein